MKTFTQMKEELAAAGGKYYPKGWSVEDIGDYLCKVDPEFKKVRAKERAKKKEKENEEFKSKTEG